LSALNQQANNISTMSELKVSQHSVGYRMAYRVIWRKDLIAYASIIINNAKSIRVSDVIES